MRKLALTTFAVAAATTLILSGCSNSARTDAGSGDAAAGFESGSTIGVALPAKTSENWVLAGDLFTKDLTDAERTMLAEEVDSGLAQLLEDARAEL